MKPRRVYPLLVLLVIMAGSLLSYAQMGVDDARLIPYSGTLENGGVAASGDYRMRFGLFPTAGADESCLLTNPTSCVPWGEQQDVTVSAGRFSVVLGKASAIVDADLAYNALFLGIAVSGPGDGGVFTIVGAKQPIVPVPWAVRAATATDYQVTGALTVGGTATVTGALTVDARSQVDGLYVGQVSDDVGFVGVSATGTLDNDSFALLSNGATTLLNGTSTAIVAANGGALIVNSANVIANKNLIAGGGILVDGNINAPSNTWTGGPTSRPEQRFSNSGAMTFETCPDGQYVCAVGVAHTSGDQQYWTGARLQIRCCAL